MVTAFRNPILEEEPFEDSQGFSFRSTNNSSSSDALNAFYVDMERKDAPQRKLSKGKSLWTRKSIKKPDNAAVTTTTTPSGAIEKVPSALHALPAPDINSSQLSLPPDDVLAPLSQSIIPDVLFDNPVWQAKELEWTTISATAFRAKHPLHNPIGPRHYKNHHTIPPHAKRENRVPSVFSPSFPPMVPSIHTRSQDSSFMPGPSRSPSGSPLPTPSSSQTGIHDPSSGARSRKPSQTAHDPVDLLDGSDPWGQQWHHHSPYDIGISRSNPESREPTSPADSVPPNNPVRPRRLSATTGQSRRKTVAPSPLSQSTSAVHLHSVEADKLQITRGFSKNRKPFRGLFGNSDNSSLKAPRDLQTTQPSDDKLGRKLSKRSSVNASARHSFVPVQPLLSSAATWQGDKKEKRGSILGRLARKFSIGRKEPEQRSSKSLENYLHANSGTKVDASSSQVKSASPEKRRESKRIPAPAVETEPRSSSSIDPPALAPESGERSSTPSDLEATITLGRLTITNPDDPSSSVTTTPAGGETPLPHSAHLSSSQNHRDPDISVLAVQKPPPPIPSKASKSFHHSISVEPSPTSPEIVSPVQPSLAHPSHSLSADHANETRSEPSPPLASVFSPPALSSVMSSQETDDSPLSRASLLVNPPTPYVQSLNGIANSSRSVQELHAAPDNVEGPKIKTSSSGKVRETETFRLVRSPSDHMYPSGQTIIAGGEQWEVIDTKSNSPKRNISATATSPISKEKSSSRSGEKDGVHSKRESKRHDKEKERSKRESRHSRESASGYQPEGGHSKRESRRQEKEKSKRKESYIQDGLDRTSSRDRENLHSRRDNRRQESSRRDSYSRLDSGDRQRPTPSTSTSSVPTRASSTELPRYTDQVRNTGRGSYVEEQRVNGSSSKPIRRERERHPSMSDRPTSAIATVAELNNVRAREAWEMDRLWKGRSMSMGQEGSNIISTPPSSRNEIEPHGHDSIHRSNTVHTAGHGSSHTYFVVQTPYQDTSSPVPFTAPPPILYTHQTAPALPFPTSSSSPIYPRNSNPPPEPIRATPYQFAPLPPSLASLDDPASKEYWAKLAGVSAHN